MRAMIATAAAALMAVGIGGLASAHAATLSGDQFDISYYYPARSTLYADAGTYTDPSRISVPKDPKGMGRLLPYSIIYNFGLANHFTAAPFNGVVFTDLTASRISNAVLLWSGDVTGLSALDLTFTHNSISLDLSDVVVHPGSYIQVSISTGYTPPKTFAQSFAVAPVPLPGSAPMFGAALLVLAGFGYGLNRWVAPKGESETAKG